MPERIQSRNFTSPTGRLIKIRGFTLLEVLVAIVLISVGIVAITKSFSRGLYLYTDIENIDLALNIAQAEMEKIKNTAFYDLKNTTPKADTNFPNFIVATKVTDKTESLKQVEATVSWEVTGGSTSITLTTLIADY